MSLAVEDDRRRDRSRSRSRDRRPRDDAERSSATRFADVREPSYIYPEDDLDDRYRSRGYRDSAHAGGLPYPPEGGMDVDAMLPGSQSLYSYDDARPIYKTASPPRESSYRSSRDKIERQSSSQLPGSFPDDHRSRRDDDKERGVHYADARDSKYERRNRSDDDYDDPRARRAHKYAREDEGPRIRDASPPRDKYSRGSRDDVSDDKLNFLPQKYSRRYDDDDTNGIRDDKYSKRDKDRRSDRDSRSKKERDEDDLAYGKPPGPSPSQRQESPPTYGSYISASQVSDKRPSRYGREDDDDRRRRPATRPENPHDTRESRLETSYRDESRHSANVLTVEPGRGDRDRSRDRRRDISPGPATLSPESDRKERDRSRDRRGGARDKSPQPPTNRMSSLTVDTGRSSNLSLAAAPASPLLESYRGTYQDCSPMPSPLLIASKDPSSDPRVIEALSPLNSDVDSPDSKKRSRRARFHDPEDIATTLARALKGHRTPDIQPLIEILPSLTHDQVMELRSQYKHIVKTGSDRKGVNIAKHIRARLKDEDPNLMKACYAVALGKWESEAYWANFWYQGDKTRRELLIESLMGRTNDEIRHIKDAFTDKKYDNSLTKCMKVELKEDKFKKAVLMVLDERRMDDFDPYGRRIPIDYHLVDQDVDDLRRAVKAEKGGESAMVAIVVKRSDAHLRHVLKEYEHHYRANFARDALKKSGNLVVRIPLPFPNVYIRGKEVLIVPQGELLAHILNGVINKPVRDALLLNHALTASRKDGLRRELLISRLVRFHWDPAHMQAVKRSYRERYGVDLQEAVREGTSGQWGEFCRELCIARMPDDVRRV
ncbi:annexin ANXC4 [Metarhizium acridum CQMa 102]|uniref:Annexin ANXC4 n=1 Tax=Metarhizium acridum (strain CQMa 102) TaxID=655827 RepID=E9EES8_METAQ|nr:annexin ANXC4 [Metarhizium acridum CQMa 102]EFY85596.1 annexin ANXC4 [Metarhizium acridum CQMa 102]